MIFSPREVFGKSQDIMLTKNGSFVDVKFWFEAEIEIICNPRYDDFPFNQHSCDVMVRMFMMPLTHIFQMTSYSLDKERLRFLPDHSIDASVTTSLEVFDYGITMSYLQFTK